MPLEEHLTEEDIKGYIPELAKFLWAEDTDYSEQKKQAVNEVKLELSSKGFNLAQIMPRLVIRNSGTTEVSDHITEPTHEDTSARLRYVLDIKIFTPVGLKTFILEGSNDKTIWESIDTRKAEAEGIVTFMISKSFLYYRLNVTISGGSIDYAAYLCDTGPEKLISYKWLELILLDKFTTENDHYHLKMKYFKSEYESLLNKIRIWIDKDGSGNLNGNEYNTISTIRILK